MSDDNMNERIEQLRELRVTKLDEACGELPFEAMPAGYPVMIRFTAAELVRLRALIREVDDE